MSSDPVTIRKCALDLLGRREHSAAELVRKLRQRNYDEALLQAVVAALSNDGLLSDERFTRLYIQSRIDKGFGPVRIMLELRERGIADDLISLHLDKQAPEWRQRVARVREKRFGAGPPGDFREQAKQMRFLEQRGFSSEQIRKLFRAGDE